MFDTLKRTMVWVNMQINHKLARAAETVDVTAFEPIVVA